MQEVRYTLFNIIKHIELNFEFEERTTVDM